VTGAVASRGRVEQRRRRLAARWPAGGPRWV